MGMMWLIFLFCLIILRFYAGYDSRFQKSKFITIKNHKLKMALIDETSFFERRKRLKQDINKMSVSGLVLYLFGFFILIASVVCYHFLPKSPVEPWEIDTDKFFMYVDTLNEKVAAGFIWIYFICMFFCLAIHMFQYCKTIDVKWIKVLTYSCSVIMLLAVFIMGFDVTKELVICFL